VPQVDAQADNWSNINDSNTPNWQSPAA